MEETNKSLPYFAVLRKEFEEWMERTYPCLDHDEAPFDVEDDGYDDGDVQYSSIATQTNWMAWKGAIEWISPPEERVLNKGIPCTEADLLEVIDERETMEQLVNDVVAEVVGSTPEWSNLYGPDEVRRDVGYAMQSLRDESAKRADRLSEAHKALARIVEMYDRWTTASSLARHILAGGQVNTWSE